VVLLGRFTVAVFTRLLWQQWPLCYRSSTFNTLLFQSIGVCIEALTGCEHEHGFAMEFATYELSLSAWSIRLPLNFLALHATGAWIEEEHHFWANFLLAMVDRQWWFVPTDLTLMLPCLNSKWATAQTHSPLHGVGALLYTIPSILGWILGASGCSVNL